MIRIGRRRLLLATGTGLLTQRSAFAQGKPLIRILMGFPRAVALTRSRA